MNEQHLRLVDIEKFKNARPAAQYNLGNHAYIGEVYLLENECGGTVIKRLTVHFDWRLRIHISTRHSVTVEIIRRPFAGSLTRRPDSFEVFDDPIVEQFGDPLIVNSGGDKLMITCGVDEVMTAKRIMNLYEVGEQEHHP